MLIYIKRDGLCRLNGQVESGGASVTVGRGRGQKGTVPTPNSGIILLSSEFVQL